VNLTVSQPIKILALVGVLAIAALGATTMLLGHSHSSTGTQEPTHSWSSSGDSNVHTSPRVRITPFVDASSMDRHFSAPKWCRACGTITSAPYGAE